MKNKLICVLFTLAVVQVPVFAKVTCETVHSSFFTEILKCVDTETNIVCYITNDKAISCLPMKQK